MYFFSHSTMTSRYGVRPGFRPISESIIALAVSDSPDWSLSALKSSFAAAAWAAASGVGAGVGVGGAAGAPFLQAAAATARRRAATAAAVQRARRVRIE